MRRILRLMSVLLPLAGAACASADAFVLPPGEHVSPTGGAVTERRGAWEARRLDDYRFRYHATCFCAFTDEVVVTVRGGRIDAVRRVADGSAVSPSEWRLFPTVDELFDRIEAAEKSDTYTSVLYHPTLGYPMEAVIGTLANDAGVAHHLFGLEPID